MTDELHEPTLRAVIEAVKSSGTSAFIDNYEVQCEQIERSVAAIEAMLPKPVSWAEQMLKAMYFDLNMNPPDPVLHFDRLFTLNYLKDNPDQWPQPSRKAVSEEEIVKIARRISLRWALPAKLHGVTAAITVEGQIDDRAAVQSILEALHRGMELSDPEAEKRGMMKLGDWLEHEGFMSNHGIAEACRHFGLGEG